MSRRELFARLLGRGPAEPPAAPLEVPGIIRPPPFSLEEFYRRRKEGS